MTLGELAELLGAELSGGDGNQQVLGVSGLDSAAPGHVTYVEDERRLTAAEAGPALAVIAPMGLRAAKKPLLRAANPRLAFARALASFYPPSRMSPGVDPAASVAKDAALGEGVAIGPYAVIGEGAKLGRGTQVHALVSIGRGVEIGPDCLIYPHVAIYDGVRLGARIIVHAGSVIGSAGFGYVWDGERHVWLPHVGTVLVEDEVEIGANTTIDRATTGQTVIGKGTKIDNLVQVAHNSLIGSNCLLAGQVGISGSVKLGDGVVLAGQAGVSDHVEMGEGSVGAAGADIIRDVKPGEIVLGRPARRIKEQMRIDAAAARLPDMVRELRELRERVEELEKKL